MSTQTIKKLLVTGVALTVILTFSACQKADVVADGGIRSFEKLVGKSQLTSTVSADNYHTFTSQLGNTFLISAKPESTNRDILASIDATPFIAAGLDASLLPEGYEVVDNRLIIFSEYSDQALEPANPTAVEAMTGLIKAQRSRFGYHEALDHFGIELGNGNMIEWAADMTTNDKDLVFVVEPSVLSDAGLNPDQVEGWLHADVTVMDQQGKKSVVKKLLQPVDLP